MGAWSFILVVDFAAERLEMSVFLLAQTGLAWTDRVIWVQVGVHRTLTGYLRLPQSTECSRMGAETEGHRKSWIMAYTLNCDGNKVMPDLIEFKAWDGVVIEMAVLYLI